MILNRLHHISTRDLNKMIKLNKKKKKKHSS